MTTLRTVRILWTFALSIIGSVLVQAAAITVTANVTPSAGLYQYDYTVSNSTANDLFDLDIGVTPGLAISGLTAPTGFKTAYDPGLGLVSFIENSAAFGPSPITGFIFNSALAPAATSYTANLADANFHITTMSGSTLGPVATPEPDSLALSALGVAALLFWRKRNLASRPQ